MQRHINACRARVQIEGAMRQITDHLVVIIRPTIMRLQPKQLVLIQRGKAIERHRPDIAARSLDLQDIDGFVGQRIGFNQFLRRVATAEICNRQVAAERI